MFWAASACISSGCDARASVNRVTSRETVLGLRGHLVPGCRVRGALKAFWRPCPGPPTRAPYSSRSLATLVQLPVRSADQVYQGLR